MSTTNPSTQTFKKLHAIASAPAKTFPSLFGTLLLAASLQGCASFPITSSNPAADQLITSDVQSCLEQRNDLEPLSVQTVNGVVYISGIVVSELEREPAETCALAVPSVAGVVNSISVSP